MSCWLCGQRIVAEPTGATVTGSGIAGGAQVHIDVAFRLVEWPWAEKGPVSLVPQPSEVTARAGRSELRLGFALPNPADVIVPSNQSATGGIRFTLSLTTSALVALEVARDGGPLELVMTLVAHPFFIAQYPGYAPGVDVRPASDTFRFQVPKEQWLALLENVDYCETLVTELRLPTGGPESTSVGRQRVANAVHARNEGRYRSSMQECRIALDALETGGFGGRAPDEVARFLQKNARKLSQSERFSALQIAMRLFLSPAHHDGVPDEELSREDADLAIAITAALLRLAPRWITEPDESGSDSDKAHR